MTRKQLLRLQLRSLRLSTWDRCVDFANMAFPIFVVVGIMAASVKFWSMVLGL